MFLDSEYSDEELFRRVRLGEETKKFISSTVGRNLVDQARKKHKLAILAMTDFSLSNYDLNDQQSREDIRKILNDLAEPTRVLLALSNLISEADKATEEARQRDMEDTYD